MTAFGVYVHIPFCASKCDYCAFATWTDRSHLVAEYLDALRIEINGAVAAGMPVADTVFVGAAHRRWCPPTRWPTSSR
jgi:coproporphyrinogen III oxidase-like Fe-S oxidoreductase